MEDFKKRVQDIHKKAANSGISLNFLLQMASFPMTTFYSWLSGFNRNTRGKNERHKMLDPLEKMLDEIIKIEEDFKKRFH